MAWYHVDRRGKLAVGQVLTPQSLDDETENVLLLGTTVAIREPLKSWFPEGLTNHGGAYTLMPWRGVPNTGLDGAQVSEMVFELIRRLEFASRPSRLQSMFACATLAEAQAFRARCGNPTDPIFEVQSQNSFVGDMRLLFGGTCPAAALELARKYWREERSGTPELEGLLGPPVTVIKLIDNTT